MNYKFSKFATVRHLKTGNVYVIEDTPDRNRLEATNEPAYGYRELAGEGIKWQRGQAEFEDGRFELNSPTP